MKLKDVLLEEKLVEVGVQKIEKKFANGLKKLQKSESASLTAKYKGKTVKIPTKGGGNKSGTVIKVVVGYFPSSQMGGSLVRVYFELKALGMVELNPEWDSIIVYD